MTQPSHYIHKDSRPIPHLAVLLGSVDTDRQFRFIWICYRGFQGTETLKLVHQERFSTQQTTLSSPSRCNNDDCPSQASRLTSHSLHLKHYRMHFSGMAGLGWLFSFLCWAVACQALTAEEWKEQSIYSVMTDRFAKSSHDSASTACSLRSYCGGTWEGLIDHLDYIQGMGFTAVSDQIKTFGFGESITWI